MSDNIIRSLEQLDHISSILDRGTLGQVRLTISSLAPFDIAYLLESSPPKHRHVLWRLIEGPLQGEVLNELPDELSSTFLKEMDPQEVALITAGLDDDDVADILHRLPESVTSEVLRAMDQQHRTRLEAVMFYPDDTAGGLMNTDAITIRADITLEVVLRFLRRREIIPEMTDNLIVVTRNDSYIGLLPLKTILVSEPNCSVREMMITDRGSIPVEMKDDDVARLFERNHWISAPVIDKNNIFLGRITIDDVVDVIRDDADHSLMSMAGLDEYEDTFSPIKGTAPRRAIWLGINLFTALIASSMINIFQETIEKVVALAVLMPIVASMGGIAGTQTLTVLIRGMAMGTVSKNNQGWLISREATIGVINGVLWALAISIIASVWFADWMIGLIIAIAVFINLLTAGIAGAILPVLLRNFRIDPALAGGVILTTITDVVGFVSFLGLATIFYA